MIAIKEKFTINFLAFSCPCSCYSINYKKTPPVVALLVGTLLGGLFALIFQPGILLEISGSKSISIAVAYRAIMDAISVSTEITTSNILLNDLFTSGGMEGMLGTILAYHFVQWFFGGIMDAIGALSRISSALLNWAQNTISTIYKYRSLLFSYQPYCIRSIFINSNSRENVC